MKISGYFVGINIPSLDVSNFDTTNVIDKSDMFYDRFEDEPGQLVS